MYSIDGSINHSVLRPKPFLITFATMRKYSLLCVLWVLFAQAQLTLSTSTLDFGDVLTTNQKEITVDINNTNTYPVTVSQLALFAEDFTGTINNGTIQPGESEKISVIFKPKHNLAYNSELIIVANDGSEYRIDLQGDGKYSDTYYASTFNKSYQDLKDELKSILANNYKNLGYTTARDNMYGDIDNVNGKVTCVYTGREVTMSTRAEANANSINCEHTWPQSLFNSNDPERSDIHHLYPTDASTNSRRSNNPFGVVTNPSWTDGGSKLGSGVFEPRNEHKGTAARAMLYFAIRYTDYGNFIDGQETILKQWHKQFQPSDWDRQRNEKIFGYQKNRNPFIDHPEFLDRINNIGSDDPTPIIKDIQVAQDQIDYSYVSPTSERIIYLINTGNTDISNITQVSSTTGNVVIKSVDDMAKVGDVSPVLISFKSLPEGTYQDNLIINLTSQTGSTIELPIRFTMGQASTSFVESKLMSAVYNEKNQHIQLKNIPLNPIEFEIWNSNGQLLLNESPKRFNEISFKNQPTGIYFVLLKTHKETYVSKFMVY